MRVVTVRLDEETYRRLLERARREGYDTVAEYLLHAALRKETWRRLEERLRRIEEAVEELRRWIPRLIEACDECCEHRT